MTVIFKTSGTSWTVPADWNDTTNIIEALGEGGNVNGGGVSGGGGGGEYRKAINITGLSGSIPIAIGTGGSGNNTTFNTSTVIAVKGATGSGGTGGAGGTGGTGAAANFDGGAGANGTTGISGKGGGGGGAGGPTGVGKSGGANGTTGGGGGGGSNGGSSTVGNGGGAANGGNGGAGTGGTGGGTGATSSTPATVGTSGGGGGGADGTLGGIAAAGGMDTAWDSSHGSGGGGGGGTGNAGGTGGAGSTYGGGGGGGNFSVGGGSGAGGQGLIIITYTAPAVIIRVQSTHVTYAIAATSQSITLGASPTNGNALILTNGGNGDTGTSGGAISSISQTGATWVKAVGINYDDATRISNAEIWYALNVSGAGTGITVNFPSGGEGGVLCVAEYSGIAASSALDKTATNHAASGTSTDTGTTATTSQANQLWVGSLGNPQISPHSYSSPTNSFTIIEQGDVNYGMGAFLEKIVTSTGAANTSATQSAGFEWAGCIATFNHSVPASANVSNFLMFM